MRFETKSGGEDDGWARFSAIASTAERDMAEDRILPGAFDPINLEYVPLLVGHDVHSAVGRLEECRQQGDKLTVRGAIRTTLAKGKEAYEQVKHGILTGVSVGFKVLNPDKDIRYDAKGRTIIRGVLLEVSLVAIPANRSARITSLKSVQRDKGEAFRRKLDVLAAGWAADDAATRRHLNEVSAKMAELMVGLGRAGAIPMADVQVHVKSLMADMRAGAAR